MGIQQKTKVICNGKTYYHYCSINPEEKKWTAIYDADYNFLFSEPDHLPVKAISLMLKAYQRGLADGRVFIWQEIKFKISQFIFLFRLKRNIRKHRADQIKPIETVDRSSLMNTLDSICRKHHGRLPHEPD